MARVQKTQFRASQIASSSVLSAVTGELRRLFMDLFPPNFFNNIRILNAAVSVQDTEGQRDRLKQYRKNNPVLAIRTNISYQKDTMGQYPSNSVPFMVDNWGPNDHRMCVWNMHDYRQELKCDLAYFKINAEIGIRVESFVQAADIIGFLNYKLYPGNFFYIPNAPLLVEIPMSILKKSADHLHYDLSKKDEFKAYVDFLRHNSILPLDIKYKKDSGKMIIAFCMYANILCKTEDLPEPETNKVGRVQDNAKIQFTMSAQVAFPRSFNLYTETKGEGEDLVDDGKIHVIDAIDNSKFEGSPDVLLNYALIRQPPQYIGKNNSAKIVWMRSFITDRDEEFDELELEGQLPPYIESYMDELIEQHDIEMLKDFCIFRLWRDECEVDDQLYYFDFRKKKLVLEKPLRNQIYRVCLYLEADKLQKHFARFHNTEDVSQFFDKDLLD